MVSRAPICSAEDAKEALKIAQEAAKRASIEYGKIRASLEKSGNVIGGLDMMIAAHARSLDAVLITNNTREFIRIENLTVENWV